MFRVSEEEFHKFMDDSIEVIPENFKEKLDNIIFIAEDYPSESDLNRLGNINRYHLLGLYSGIPYTHRSTYYYGALPDRIILFQRNIEAICNSESELKNKIREVMIHEVAHYFGMTDDEIRQAGY